MGKVTNDGRTVATKGTDHIAAAIAPDVCKAPTNPRSFANWVRSTELKKGQTTTVKIDGHPIWTSIGELGPKSEPPHIGVGGGVVSFTYRAEAKAVSYSRTLNYEGNPAVRTEDLTSQNHENTVGRVVEGMSLARLLAEFTLMLMFKRQPSWGKDVVITRRGNQLLVLDRKNKVFYSTGDTLRIAGDPRFVQQTREAMYTLYDTRSGKQLMNDLVDSKHSVTIMPTNAQNGSCRAINYTNATTPGVGSGSTVQWNPNYSQIGSDPRGPAVVLGHELSHADHNALGINANGPRDSYPGQQGASARGEERQTVGTGGTSIVDPAGNTQTVPDYSNRVPSENSFRQDLGLGPRTSYYPPNWPGGPPW